MITTLILRWQLIPRLTILGPQVTLDIGRSEKIFTFELYNA